MYVNPQDDFTRLDTALSAAHMAWWEMEIPSGVVFFGENKVRMLGRDPKDFVHYKNFTDLLHPDDYDKTMKAMSDHLEGKADSYEVTYRIKHKDGHYLTYYDRGRIVQKKDGAVRVAGIVLNATGVPALVET